METREVERRIRELRQRLDAVSQRATAASPERSASALARIEKAVGDLETTVSSQTPNAVGQLIDVVIESTPTQLAYFDSDFNVIYVNSAYASNLGMKRETLIGQNHFDLFPSEEKKAIFEEVRDTGKPLTFHSVPFFPQDHSERDTTYWDWTLIPVVRNQESGLVLSLVDATEGQRMKREIAQYANRLRSLHETDRAILEARSIGDMSQVTLQRLPEMIPCNRAYIVTFDDDGVSASVSAIYDPDEGAVDRLSVEDIERDWAAVLNGSPPLEGALSLNLYAAADAVEDQARPVRSLLQMADVDGCIITPLKTESEWLGALVLGLDKARAISILQEGILREVADRITIATRQARLQNQHQAYAENLEQRIARRAQALRRSRARLKAIFKSVDVGIALIDRETLILETTNPALEQILGYGPNELIGVCLSDLLHPEDRERGTGVRRMLDHPSEASRRRAMRRYVCKDGKRVWIQLTASAVEIDMPRQLAIVVMDDITEQRQTRKALIQSERLAVAGKLAAALAHEINNPLQSVIGCLGLAEEGLRDEGPEAIVESLDLLSIALDELERTASIVAQLRDLQKPPGSEGAEPADLNRLIQDVVRLTRKESQRQRVEIDVHIDESLPQVIIVPDAIKQAALNLTLNALEAMPQGGRLEIRTERAREPSDGVRVSFADTGGGIDPEVLPHIFEPFYSTKPEGMGVGLFVSQRIVREEHGEITVENQFGKGATFNMWLPLDWADQPFETKTEEEQT